MSFALKIGRVYFSPVTVVTALMIVYLSESAFALLIYAFAAIHELGHLICMKLCKIKTERVDIYPLSVAITPDKTRFLTYRQQAIIAAGGPLTSLFAAVLFLAVGHFFHFTSLPICVFGNLWLFLINMLPIPLLDGGKIFESFIMTRTDFIKGEQICKICAYIACAVSALAGCYIFYITKYNASLLITSIYMAISLYFSPRS